MASHRPGDVLADQRIIPRGRLGARRRFVPAGELLLAVQCGVALPIATAVLRRRPASAGRATAVPPRAPASSASLRRHRSASRGVSSPGLGCHSAAALDGAASFKGQTSWQTSHPKTRLPIAGRSVGRNRSARLDGEVRRCSGSRRAPGAPQERPVGQASRHRVQVAAPVERRPSGSRSSVERMTDRKNQDPRSGLTTQRVLALPTDAGVVGEHLLLDRPGVHVGARLERSGLLAHPRQQRRQACGNHDVVVAAPGVP